MKQYLQLLRDIKEKGTLKPAARAGMPGTISLFGYQFRHNLADGFPLLTTKKMYWKGIVVELLWFLRGDTNIKYLVDNGCNIWNEDAYNYYLKKCKEFNCTPVMQSVNEFVDWIKRDEKVCEQPLLLNGFKYGNCGYQYGRVWRKWEKTNFDEAKVYGERQYIFGWMLYKDITKISDKYANNTHDNSIILIDQIKNVIESLKKTPESRRHIVTAIDPAHDKDLALYWCHAMFQFNCRPIEYFEGDGLTYGEVGKFYYWIIKPHYESEELKSQNFVSFKFESVDAKSMEEIKSSNKYPTYFLDCQLYQRSADIILGVPFNIASYALLTHIIAKICNMIPGEFIHTFGDVHIYENHLDAVKEQLQREPRELPTLNILANLTTFDGNIDELLKCIDFSTFSIENYNPHPKLESETKLSTGLK